MFKYANEIPGTTKLNKSLNNLQKHMEPAEPKKIPERKPIDLNCVVGKPTIGGEGAFVKWFRNNYFREEN